LIAYYLAPVRKPVALLNIRTAFPEKSEKEIRRLCRRTYRHYGMIFFEYCALYRMPREKISGMVEFSPPDMLQRALAKKRGAVAVTGHFGSFELMAVAIGLSGIPIVAVARPMKNPRVNAFIERLRKINGLKIIRVKDGFSRVMASVQKGNLVTLVSDQDAGKKGVLVDFFGVASSTPVGAAVLSIRLGTPIVAAFIIREGAARYRVEFHDISCDNLPEDTDEQIREITGRYTSLLESYVRKYPDHYFWMHKRWKSTGLYRKPGRVS